MHQLSIVLLLIMNLSTSTAQQCDQRLINSVVDFVMEMMVNKFSDSFNLPNVSTQFLANTGKLDLTSGKLEGLQTIRRVGDLHVELKDGKMDVTIMVEFDSLTVSYESYYLSVLGVQSIGSLQTTITENLIRVVATMENESVCFLDVDKVKFVKFGDFDVDLHSGCNFCNKISSWLTTKILNLFKQKIRSLVEARIDSILQKMLDPREHSMVCKKMFVKFNK